LIVVCRGVVVVCVVVVGTAPPLRMYA